MVNGFQQNKHFDLFRISKNDTSLVNFCIITNLKIVYSKQIHLNRPC